MSEDQTTTLDEVKSEADATAAELKKHEDADAAMIKAARTPSVGRIVIVRSAHGPIAPGIITAVHEDGTIDAQLFRGDHMTHAAHHEAEVGPDAESGAGWYWPPRV